MKKIKITIFVLLLSSMAFAKNKNVGGASYYSNKFHGRRTTSGIPYHKDSMTCAHRTLPFGTYLKVRNLRNDKEVIVKVTDRGPHVRGRIIDLSYAAAKQLDFIARGLTQVKITNLGKDARVTPSEQDTLDLEEIPLRFIAAPVLYLKPDNTRISLQKSALLDGVVEKERIKRLEEFFNGNSTQKTTNKNFFYTIREKLKR